MYQKRSSKHKSKSQISMVVSQPLTILLNILALFQLERFDQKKDIGL